MVPVEIGSLQVVVVQEIVFGGYGLTKIGSWVVFIDSLHGVLPGETVEVCIQKRQKNYFWASLSRILLSSPRRVAPNCPHFGICGGCQLQHLLPEDQTNTKTNWLRTAFRRSFKEQDFYKEWNVVSTTKPWKWRRRIFLHATYQNQSWRWGYYQKDNQSLCQPTTCPIFDDNALLWQEISSFFENLTRHDRTKMEGQKIEVCITKMGETASDRTSFGIILHVTGPLPEGIEECISPFWKYFEAHGIDRVFCQGNLEISENIVGLNIHSTPHAFAQNHPDAYSSLYQDLLQQITIKPPAHIYDLYSGIGVLSVLLASFGYSVDAIEYDKAAAEKAKMNAKVNGVSTSVVVHQGRVEEKISRLQKPAARWIVNPPRSGLSDEVCEVIKKKRVEELFYISCQADTLVRDINRLKMEVVWGQGYDLFPQTTHFETLVKLRSPTS